MRGSFHQGLALAETALTSQTVGNLHVVWRKPLTISGFAPNTGSVAVVGGVVYVGGKDVRAFDATTGALLWHRGVGAPVITTPAFAQGRVVVGTLRTGVGARVVALDAATGAVRWSKRLGQAFVFDSVTISGRRVFVTGSQATIGGRTLTSFALGTGAVLWRAAIRASSSPTVGAGTLVVDTNDGSRLRALDPDTGKTIWSASLGAGAGGSTDAFTPAIMGQTVYAGGIAGNVVALNVRTGAQRWRTPLGSAIFRSIAVAPGEVF